MREGTSNQAPARQSVLSRLRGKAPKATEGAAACTSDWAPPPCCAWSRSPYGRGSRCDFSPGLGGFCGELLRPLRSTQRTDRIENLVERVHRQARPIWLIGSGGVRSAANARMPTIAYLRPLPSMLAVDQLDPRQQRQDHRQLEADAEGDDQRHDEAEIFARPASASRSARRLGLLCCMPRKKCSAIGSDGEIDHAARRAGRTPASRSDRARTPGVPSCRGRARRTRRSARRDGKARKIAPNSATFS